MLFHMINAGVFLTYQFGFSAWGEDQFISIAPSAGVDILEIQKLFFARTSTRKMSVYTVIASFCIIVPLVKLVAIQQLSVQSVLQTHCRRLFLILCGQDRLLRPPNQSIRSFSNLHQVIKSLMLENLLLSIGCLIGLISTLVNVIKK